VSRASRSDGVRIAAPLLPALATVVVLFGGALVGAVRTSVVPLGGGVTLDAWRTLLEDPAFVDAAWFSLRITLFATAVSAVGAVAVAGLLRSRGTVVRGLAALPVPVPHLLIAVVAVVWLAPGGLAERALGALPFSLVRDDAGLGIVAVYAYKEIPFLVLLLLASMGGSLREREEAAAVLGASALQRLAWVTWPTIRGPLVVGSIVVAAFVLGAFEVPLAVGPNYPPTLATYAYEATQRDVLAGEGVAAAALLLTALAAIGLAAAAVRLARTAEGG
jgi:putative spermidine/putrescine transport system permease protein